jgi:lipopolysaccharide transport system ATP-binding protein
MSSSFNASSGPAVRAEGLGKCFRLWDDPKDRLKHPVRAMLARWGVTSPKTYYHEFWALQDVEFELPRGASLGVLGRNGSGKSTLLQVLCGILEPTTGSCSTQGRVSALLELGMGFNPEFTGRENVFMNTGILGLTKEETEGRLDDILAFADIGDFIDQPVKTYSSGMYVRLAFAVAINVDPDILVVDEALAVGDVLFQSKCYRKFRAIREAGKTVIFVTHSTDLVLKHCDRAMVLEGGQMRYLGPAKQGVSAYLDLLYGANEGRKAPNASSAMVAAEQIEEAREERSAPAFVKLSPEEAVKRLHDDTSTDDRFGRRLSYNPHEFRYGDSRAFLVDYLVVSDGQADIVTCDHDKPVEVYVRAYFAKDVADPVFGLTLQSVDGIDLGGDNTHYADVQVPPQTAGDSLVVRFSFTPRMTAGDYMLALGIAEMDDQRGAVAVDRRYAVATLQVHNPAVLVGMVDLGLTIDVLA